MIVVMGREPSVLVGLADRLRSRDISARVLADGESLFDVVWEHGARAVVVVDALPSLAGNEPHCAPADWDEVLRVARGPKRPRVVWCTARADDEGGARLRRSGIPYVTVRTGTLVSSADLGLDDVRGRTVHLARDLPVPDSGLTPLGELLDALSEATATERAGHVYEVRHAGRDAWAKVIEQLGGRPKPTARTMARVMSWVGARALLEVPSRGSRLAVVLSFGGGAGVPAPVTKEVEDERPSAR